MNKKIILLIVSLFTTTLFFAQSNVIKLSSVSTSNPYNDKFFEFERSSFAASYEYAHYNHSSFELLLVYARSISYDYTLGYGGEIVVPVAGPGVEFKWRYYFQTNPNFITYAPYGWYAAPSVSYTSMKGSNNAIDKSNLKTDTVTGLDFVDATPGGMVTHNINYMAVGALAGYQFIMEEFEQGVVFDFGLGFNYIASSSFKDSRVDSVGDGLINKDITKGQKLNKLIPKLHFSIGFTF